MSAERLVEDALNDILEAASKAIEFVDDMDSENLSDDDKTGYAVIRALEVVGEAARRIPESFREKHPDIPWSEMAGMRNKLIHDYFGVDLDVVLNTVHEDLPPLVSAIQTILTSKPDCPEYRP
jgi:uncharacterized protein with HEPN domain